MDQTIGRMQNTSKLNFRIKVLYMLTIPTLILSLACVVVGIISVWKSAPYYKLPFCSGGAMIAGLTTSLCGIWYIRFYRKYVNNERDHMESADYELWSRKSFFVWGLVMIGCLAALVAGIWGVVYVRYSQNSTAPPPTESSFSFSAYGRQNQAAAIATLTLSLVLTIFMIIFKCCDLSYEWYYKEDRRDYFNFYSNGTWIHLDNYRSSDALTYNHLTSPDTSVNIGNRHHQRTADSILMAPVALRQTGANLITAPIANGNSEGFRNSRTYDSNDREISSITGRNEIRRDLRHPRTFRHDTNNRHNSYVRPQRFETPPPRYEEVCETPPPKYSETNLYIVATYI
ncbi:hypothetical protein ACF0H5_006430 [Mactra antiquata]